ncbi:MAG: FliH/SctL family protein [bacterium]
MPDDEDLSPNVYKQNEVVDEETRMTIHQMGPEEKLAGKVLKNLKEKISDARNELESVREEKNQLLEEGEQQKQEMLEQAESEAEQIIEEAEAEAEEIISSQQEVVDEARQEGYDDGYEDGMEDAQSEMADNIRLSEYILEEARRERDAFVESYEDQIVQLARRMAERVVREVVSIDDEVARRVVQETLEEVRDVQEITIILHPDDYDSVQEVIDRYRDNHPSLEEINLVEESKMSRGGCRIRTNFGDLEATVGGTLEFLADQLIEESLGVVDESFVEQTEDAARERFESDSDDSEQQENDTEPPLQQQEQTDPGKNESNTESLEQTETSSEDGMDSDPETN